MLKMNVRDCRLECLSKLIWEFAASVRGACAAQPVYKFDAATGLGLYRNIGSAVMSGRIAAIDAVEAGAHRLRWICQWWRLEVAQWRDHLQTRL
jgi:hypothetical protein